MEELYLREVVVCNRDCAIHYDNNLFNRISHLFVLHISVGFDHLFELNGKDKYKATLGSRMEDKNDEVRDKGRLEGGCCSCSSGAIPFRL